MYMYSQYTVWTLYGQSSRWAVKGSFCDYYNMWVRIFIHKYPFDIAYREFNVQLYEVALDEIETSQPAQRQRRVAAHQRCNVFIGVKLVAKLVSAEVACLIYDVCVEGHLVCLVWPRRADDVTLVASLVTTRLELARFECLVETAHVCESRVHIVR